MLAFPAQGDAQGLRERGAYVLRAAGCIACHTDEENGGDFLGGGRALATPFGTFYSPNITFDPRHGIGGWSESDLARALRHGVAPGGEDLYPVFPYTSYTRMHDDDIRALYAYLITVPFSRQENRPHDIPWYMRWRLVNWVWKKLFFEPGPYRADDGQTDRWNRGAYLVRALAHCSECHTPRDDFGVMDMTRFLAGTKDGPEGDSVPNITPDRETGIGKWSRNELLEYLSSGMDPDGDFAGGLMVGVIDESLAHLTSADREAIVDYIRSIPPISNRL